MQTLGTKIVLDEEKILREGKYDLNHIYELIDDLANQLTLIKKDKHTFMTRGNEQDLANLGLFCRLGKFDWIAENVSQWWWIEYGKYLDYLPDMHELREYERLHSQSY